MGNTCFANAVMQFLTAFPGARNAKSWEHDAEVKPVTDLVETLHQGAVARASPLRALAAMWTLHAESGVTERRRKGTARRAGADGGTAGAGSATRRSSSRRC